VKREVQIFHPKNSCFLCSQKKKVLDQFALSFSRKKGRQNGQTELTTESAGNDQGKNTSARCVFHAPRL